LKTGKMGIMKGINSVLSRKFYYFLIPVLFFQFCSPSAEDYKKKASKALEEENAAKWMEYMQRAHEAYLGEKFFPLGDNLEFSDFYSSAERNMILLVANQASKKKSTFVVYLPDQDENWKRKIRGYIQDAAVSPEGRYFFVVVRNADLTCEGHLWETEEKEEVLSVTGFECMQKGAVLDDGTLLYAKSGDIVLHKLKGGIVEKNKLPSSPIESLPGWVSVQISPRKNIFFTYGSAGLYYLYYLDSGEFHLVSKQLSHPKLFFYPDSDSPGGIMGGADEHKVYFFGGSGYGKTVKTYPVRYWQDALFFDEDLYFFVEEQRLCYYEKKEQCLSIWANKLFGDKKGNVFFLTPLGHFGEISINSTVPQEAERVFGMGWENVR